MLTLTIVLLGEIYGRQGFILVSTINLVLQALCEKCPNTAFLWSAFFCIRTEYEPKKSPHLDTFQAVKRKNNCNFDDASKFDHPWLLKMKAF